ncbi:hypothetical protein ACSVH2_05725 [Flavobacterium sp. RSB2_4_14]|uniref:hypothetical protein n=1 Tax=Flavobacterium sp. RSB2_4_14 TaxID=3447665 RepID=UPI003F2F6BD3
MKKTLFFLVLFSLFLSSCQNEEETIIQNPENSFVKSSPLASLISRVSQNETTKDNVLDGTSCFSVKLPVSININNQNITVSNENDYEEVQEIKDEYSTDNDIVYFVFPITIVYTNFQQITVNNQNQWNTIIAQCGDDSDFHEITCADFNYPISINIYNTNNQIGSSITITNDSQLNNFIQDLTDSEVVGIVYPITLTNTSNQIITVNNNTQLENYIDSVIDDCETPGTVSLADVLTDGTWYISYCYLDDDDTYYYNGYNFTFSNDGTIIAQKNSTIVEGDWDIHNENSYQELELHFDGDFFEEIETGWKVIEFDNNNVRTKKQTSNGTYYLNFKKN